MPGFGSVTDAVTETVAPWTTVWSAIGEKSGGPPDAGLMLRVPLALLGASVVSPAKVASMRPRTCRR